MDYEQVLGLCGSQSSAIQKLLSKITDDIAYVAKEKHRVEDLALYYQAKIASRSRDSEQQGGNDPAGEFATDDTQRPAKRRRSSQSDTEILARKQAELDASKARIASLSNENHALEEKIETRDRVIAADAKELDTLRQEREQLHDLQIRLKATEAELKTAEMRSQRDTLESQVRLSIGEENTRFLNVEVKRLSEEVAKARFAADTATVSHAAATRVANERNKQLSEQLAEAKSQIIAMDDYISKIEAENTTSKSAAERDKKDYDEETARLNRIVEIQKDLTQEAEQRVRDYEEIVRSLKEEIGARGKESAHKGKLGAHAEVLLKNLQDALDSRIRLLHQQKEEMERARASEMALLAREETLIREAEDARWETEQAKKEMARLRIQMQDQARKIAHLEKQVELNDADQQRDSMVGLLSSHQSLRRSSDFANSEVGPRTDFEARQPVATPDTLHEVDAAVQELADIRRRHHKLLMTMRDRRAAYS